MATKPPKWRNSKEKDILYKDITKGNVAGMAPILVYGMHDGIYHKFKYKNFRNNLLRLRKSVADNEDRASAAKAAYDHDKQYYKKPADRFAWRGSKAQEMLRKDIASGDVPEDFDPMQARLSRLMCALPPLSKTEWRNHLWQERRRHFNSLDPDEKKKIIQMKNKKLFTKDNE